MNDWTIIKILSWTESYFQKQSIDSPRLTAEILLSHCLGIKRLDLYLQFDRPLHQDELTLFKELIKRRIQKEPVAYITGEKGFFDSDFKVDSGVLIPRPDTETLVEQVLKVLSAEKDSCGAKSILELGTGSGAIIISLAKEYSEHSYYATDVSCAAIKVAKKNACRIVGDKICFVLSSWFSSIVEKPVFDMIISNPPYIPSKDIKSLQPEIKKFEPLLALDGGEDGFDSYRLILNNAHSYLQPGGMILFEIGFDQKKGMEDILSRYPQYETADFVKDLAGHDRVAIIKKSID